jgi:hypothetical protein
MDNVQNGDTYINIPSSQTNKQTNKPIDSINLLDS